jgi:hypothetical protein
MDGMVKFIYGNASVVVNTGFTIPLSLKPSRNQADILWG